MRVALVAPVEESIPPRTYGGIEAVVHLLDKGLVERGHEVMLLASGGSASRGHLVPLTDAPLTAAGRDVDPEDMVARKEAAARQAATALADLHADVVLNHSWRLLDHMDKPQCPVLTTVHYPLDRDPSRSVFLERPNAMYVSVSWSQQRAINSLRFVANIYNGIDLDALPFSDRSDGYLAFLGHVSPDKGLDLAIRAAHEVGTPLRVAAKLDRSQRPWFDAAIAPLFRGGGVELIGEVSAVGRAELLEWGDRAAASVAVERALWACGGRGDGVWNTGRGTPPRRGRRGDRRRHDRDRR